MSPSTTLHNFNLDNMFKPNESVDINTPKPISYLSTQSDTGINYVYDQKRSSTAEAKDDNARPVAPLKFPDKDVTPTRQNGTSSSTSIDSSKQPPGYAYTDNFSDPIIKSVE
ncbi:unnamed protein product, partial [Allacma fusca]